MTRSLANNNYKNNDRQQSRTFNHRSTISNNQQQHTISSHFTRIPAARPLDRYDLELIVNYSVCADHPNWRVRFKRDRAGVDLELSGCSAIDRSMDIPLQMLVGIGLVLCALVMGQVALWSTTKVRDLQAERSRFLQQQQALRQALANTNSKQVASILDSIQSNASWKGFRQFVVQQLIRETENTTSVYLVPADGKPIASFRPGQHLTLRMAIPGQAKPIVRCYSLSDSPGKSYYRISVKEVPPPLDRPELGCGKASHYINRCLTEGQLVDVKAPAGEFYLDEDSDRLLILLAGGIGITPMISMLSRLVDANSRRTTLLMYGVKHGQDHPFKRQLHELVQVHGNLHLVNCYSRPQPTDQLGADFHVQGNVNINLLKKLIKVPDAEFYLCGPPSFMQSLYDGLLEWGANPNDIHFEAFGPASIQPAPSGSTMPSEQPEVTHPIKFARSDTTAIWDGQQTLLELAESLQVPIDSGCRAGSCGTCCVPIISGAIEYPGGQKPDCPAGHCLMCIAKPIRAVELNV
jgi:ferredoxin-NADP reductase